jgi:hypothetical protein
VRNALARGCCVLAALGASAGGILAAGAAAFLTNAGNAAGQVPVSSLSVPGNPAVAGSAGKITITWSAATIGSTLAAASNYTVERYSTTGTDLGAASCGSVPSSSGNPNAFGSFSCVDTPSAGTYKYVITAWYAGTSWSTATGYTSTASPGTTTTAVSSSANPSNAGKLVTYTATVTPSPSGTVTGNVEFFDGGTAISGCTSQALSAGPTYQATCQVTYTTVATHTITASYLGSTAYATSTSSSLTETISKAAPTLAAAGPSTGTPGTTIAASAITGTLASTSGTNASGTVSFTVFGPQTTAPTTCTTGGTSLGTASVSGNGSYHPSSSFTPSAEGNYWVYASYAGDTNNSAANSACPPTAEIVVSGKASDTLSLNPPDTGVQGTAMAASSIIATLASVSGSNAGGTITYKVYGPQTTAPTTCTTGGTTVGTATVSGGGNYTPSAGYTPTSTGTYWWYASYGGDTNNSSANSGCGSSMQSTTVTLPPTTITLSAPGSAMVNATIAANAVTATLSGGTSTAGGTVTFTVFGPQATAPTTCTSGGTVVSTGTVSGNGAYHPASSETVPAVGDYWLYASYSGDANNGASDSTCGSGMTEVSIFSATSAASTNDTSLDATTSLSFTMAPSTSYVLFVMRHSAASDSIKSVTSSGVSSSLSLTSVASQTYNTTGYQWAYWFTSPSSGSGSETLTITFTKTLASGEITIADLAQLGGVDTTNPIVTATKATTNGSSTTATANLASAPASSDAQLVFVNGQDNLGAATPSASPTMTNFFSTEQTAGSGAAYVNAPATQNESFSLGATSHHWGTIALELNNG